MLLALACLLYYPLRRGWFHPNARVLPQPVAGYIDIENLEPYPFYPFYPLTVSLDEMLGRDAAGELPPQLAVVDWSVFVPGDSVALRKGAPPVVGRMSALKRVALGMRININKASRDELQALPGVGPVTAARIVQLRESAGTFKSIYDLDGVEGIGEKKIEMLRAYITAD